MSESLPLVLFTLGVPREHLSPLDGLAEVRVLDNGFSAAPRDRVLAGIGDAVGLISRLSSEFSGKH